MSTRPPETPDDLVRLIENAKTQLEHIIDASPQGILLTDVTGTIMRVNQSLLNLLNKDSFADVLGQPISELFPSPNPSEAGFVSGLLDSAIASPTQVSHEVEFSLAGRGPCVLNFTLLSSTRYANELIVVMIEDITDRKQAELVREREHRTAASRAIIAAILHELNQPLTVIVVRANLLRMAHTDGSLAPDELAAGLTDILEQANLCSEKLAAARDLREFVDEPYTDGTPDLRIVDFDLSADAERRRTRILVIEGSAEASEILVLAGDSRIETILADSLAEAEEKLASDGARLDIVLVDLDLVTKDGGALPDFRASTAAPLLVVTSDPGSDLTARAMAAGALDVLTKPLTSGHLLYALQRASRHGQIREPPPQVD